MAAHPQGVWGIDMGQSALKAIRLELHDDTLTATAFDYIEHPKILSQPDADPDQLTREALEQFLSRNNLKGDIVVLSVPGQSGLARFVKLPPVEEKKIADIVRFEAKQQIPFPLEEVIWDFQKIGTPEVTDGFAMETEIGLFAMKRDIISRALQQFKEVNVEVHVVQMAPLCLANYIAYDLLAKQPREEGAKRSCVVALDIGTDNSNLVITDGDKIIWQRPIPQGGNHFTRALTKDLKLTFAKAEHLKKNAIKSPDLKKILASLKSVLNDFVGEVQRSLGYFTNTHRDAQIEYMVGLGNAFRLPGLQKFLQEKLQLEVRKVQKLERMQGEAVTAAPPFAENVLGFAVAYGAALQGLKVTMLQTNLLPHEIRVERVVRAKKPWAVAAAAALMLAVAGYTFGRSVEKSVYQNPEIEKEIAKNEQAHQEATKNKSKYDELVASEAKSIEDMKKLNAGVENRSNWKYLFQFVNEVLPSADGKNLTTRADDSSNPKELYDNADSKRALELLEQRRYAKYDPNKGQKERETQDNFIKQNLIQINIEGVCTMYTESPSSVLKSLKTSNVNLIGLTEADKEVVMKLISGNEADVKDKIPDKAWVVEVRGYTYHKATKYFVVRTIRQNIAAPERSGIVLSDMVKKVVSDNKSFTVLYLCQEVNNPVPGQFQYIGSSYLPQLVGGGPTAGAVPAPGAPDAAAAAAAPAGGSRAGWRPMGEAASGAFRMVAVPGAQPIFNPAAGTAKTGTPTQPPLTRTEFVILFFWKEQPPTAGAPPAGTTPAVPTNPT